MRLLSEIINSSIKIFETLEPILDDLKGAALQVHADLKECTIPTRVQLERCERSLSALESAFRLLTGLRSTVSVDCDLLLGNVLREPNGDIMSRDHAKRRCGQFGDCLMAVQPRAANVIAFRPRTSDDVIPDTPTETNSRYRASLRSLAIEADALVSRLRALRAPTTSRAEHLQNARSYLDECGTGLDDVRKRLRELRPPQE